MSEIWLFLFWTGILCAAETRMPPPVMEVPVGATVVMPCPSNDDTHIFQFWQMVGDRVIGPTNLLDRAKYKFDVPSGTLYIRSVSTAETGFYRCVSKNIDDKRLIVKAVELIVRKTPEEYEDAIFETNLFRGMVSVGAILVLLLVGILFFILCRRRGTSKFGGKAGDESLADASARNGTYNPTTVPISMNQKPGTSQGLDNPAMEADFPKVFQSMQRREDDLV